MTESPAPTIVGVAYGDPWSPFTWGLQPVARRVQAVYGASVRVEWRMASAFDDLDRFRAEMRLEGPALAEWLHRALARTRNPVDPEFLEKGQLGSTTPACRAVTGAQRLDPARGDRYLRRLLEYLQVRAVPADAAVLGQCARDVGLDPNRLLESARDPATEALLTAHRKEMASEGTTFEAITWRRADGERARVEEEYEARRHEEAIDRLAPGLAKRHPAGVAEYVGRHLDLVTEREVAVVFGWSLSEAAHELEVLWKRGEVERWSYGGGAYWTGPHRAGRPRPLG